MSIINLLPDDYLAGQHRRRTNVLCVALFAIVMVAVVSASLVSRGSAARTWEGWDRANKSYEQAAQTIAQLQMLQSHRRTILKKRDLIVSLLERVPKSVVLAAITNARPTGVSLVSLKLDTRFPRPDGPSPVNRIKRSTKPSQAPLEPAPARRPPPEVSVEVSGLAHTDIQVARFLANLTHSGLMRSVDLSYSQEKRDGKEEGFMLREFRLTCHLRADADARVIAESAFGGSGGDESTSGPADAEDSSRAPETPERNNPPRAVANVLGVGS